MSISPVDDLYDDSGNLITPNNLDNPFSETGYDKNLSFYRIAPLQVVRDGDWKENQDPNSSADTNNGKRFYRVLDAFKDANGEQNDVTSKYTRFETYLRNDKSKGSSGTKADGNLTPFKQNGKIIYDTKVPVVTEVGAPSSSTDITENVQSGTFYIDQKSSINLDNKSGDFFTFGPTDTPNIQFQYQDPKDVANNGLILYAKNKNTGKVEQIGTYNSTNGTVTYKNPDHPTWQEIPVQPSSSSNLTANIPETILPKDGKVYQLEFYMVDSTVLNKFTGKTVNSDDPTYVISNHIEVSAINNPPFKQLGTDKHISSSSPKYPINASNGQLNSDLQTVHSASDGETMKLWTSISNPNEKEQADNVIDYTQGNTLGVQSPWPSGVSLGDSNSSTTSPWSITLYKNNDDGSKTYWGQYSKDNATSIKFKDATQGATITGLLQGTGGYGPALRTDGSGNPLFKFDNVGQVIALLAANAENDDGKTITSKAVIDHTYTAYLSYDVTLPKTSAPSTSYTFSGDQLIGQTLGMKQSNPTVPAMQIGGNAPVEAVINALSIDHLDDIDFGTHKSNELKAFPTADQAPEIRIANGQSSTASSTWRLDVTRSTFSTGTETLAGDTGTSSSPVSLNLNYASSASLRPMSDDGTLGSVVSVNSTNSSPAVGKLTTTTVSDAPQTVFSAANQISLTGQSGTFGRGEWTINMLMKANGTDTTSSYMGLPSGNKLGKTPYNSTLTWSLVNSI